MSKKNKMPSRKVGGVYSTCMESVLIGALECKIHILEDDLNDSTGDKNEIEEDINTLKYFIQKANKKRYKIQKKQLCK